MKEFVIVPDIKAEIKFFWNIFLKDVAVLGLVIFATMLLSQLFPEEQSKQQYIFMGLGFILAIYLDLRPRTNPGKRNYKAYYFAYINR